MRGILFETCKRSLHGGGIAAGPQRLHASDLLLLQGGVDPEELDRFFALYASVNTFTRTVATVARREGVYKRFPARAGDRIVL